MADECARCLCEQGDHLFGKRMTLVSLWQEIANNFYVERADFTVQRTVGTTFAENLITSFPMMVRRDLGNCFSTMLRPTGKDWFHTRLIHDEMLDAAGKRWLEMSAGIMRRAMYDRRSQFVRATKEADHDFAAFGQAAISIELNRDGDGLLYRCWHLRDVAWAENDEGQIDTIHRKWKPYAKDLVRMFPKTVSEHVRKLAEKEPYTEIEVRHCVVPKDVYESYPGARKMRQPYVSCYVEVGEHNCLEVTGSWTTKYTIPRWQTVSGSQYAYSPATVAALPDARLLQAMALTILECGERFTNPPMVAVQEAIRSDIQLFAGGITWVDAEYDERLGEVLRPLQQDKSGAPIGQELLTSIHDALKTAFFLDKITLPSMGSQPEMTAFEVGQRVQEYIRQTMPLFEPMELDYNGALCEATFDLMLRNGGFGPMQMIPPSLRGQEVRFRFESPLADAIEAQKAGKLGESKQLLAQVADLDPAAAHMLDAKTALRDALEGIGVPAKWVRSDQEMQAIDQAVQRQQQMQQLLGGMQQSADVAKTLNDAGLPLGQMLGAQGAQQAAA